MLTVINDMLSAWAGLLIVFLAGILIALAALAWIILFRKSARHRRKRRRINDDHQRPNPTLAQIGGLPPARKETQKKPSDLRTSSSIPRS